MTSVFYTVDTELSPALHQRGVSPLENLQSSVLGIASDGEWGIRYQIERLNAHGLRGVFFVEALCAYLGDGDIVKRIIEPVLQNGHEVQLHLHTEWLNWVKVDPVEGRRGDNIFDFSVDDQRRLLELGLEALVRAGAPRPTAFRAGNYGANNDTLRALHGLSVRYDTSYNEAFLAGDCRIECAEPLYQPSLLDGVIEVPITSFEDYPGHTRPLQLTAASAAELSWVIDDSVSKRRPSVVIVSHSFELLNRKRGRANRLLVRRFDDLCAALQHRRAIAPTAHFASFDVPDRHSAPGSEEPIRSTKARTAMRMLEQAVGNLLYEVV